MQPVEECLCRAVLLQGFAVTSFLHAYHIFHCLKSVSLWKHKVGFFGDSRLS